MSQKMAEVERDLDVNICGGCRIASNIFEKVLVLQS